PSPENRFVRARKKIHSGDSIDRDPGMNFFTRTDKSIFGRWWWTVDRVTLSVFFIIAVIGVMLVAAASPPVATRIGVDANHFTIRHMIVLIPALSAMIAISMMSLQQVWRT